jgi:hypothetical protein
MALADPGRLLPTVRAWAVLVFGCLAIAYGLLTPDPQTVMLGFAVLGCEPIARAANGNGRVA